MSGAYPDAPKELDENRFGRRTPELLLLFLTGSGAVSPPGDQLLSTLGSDNAELVVRG
jgi:hypothetical protein